MRVLWALALVMAWWLVPAAAAPLVLDSGVRQVQLVELYTSQGCSSCPPAEAWLSGLRDHPGLWREIVPVALHVDYWDFLGWKDPFSQAAFSQRQRDHRSQGHVSRIYTPGFVVDGREWFGFFGDRTLPQSLGPAPRLSVTLDADRLEATFTGEPRPLQLHVALLGFGMETAVARGENRGRRLAGDFVALSLQTLTSTDNRWQGRVTTAGLPRAARYALAVWVTPQGSLRPLQAVGGWLPDTKAAAARAAVPAAE